MTFKGDVDKQYFDEFNKEDFIKEVIFLYQSIENGSLSLSSEEENNLKLELKYISDSLNLNFDEIINYKSQKLDEVSLDNTFRYNREDSSKSFNGGIKNQINNEIGNNDSTYVFNVKSNISNVINYSSNDSIKDGSVLEDVVDSGVEDGSVLEDVVDSGVEDGSAQDLSVEDALNDLIDDYSNEPSIKVENLTMDFKISKDKIDSLKEFFIKTIKRKRDKSTKFRALNNISFEIPKGDRVGIIGFNGAGKSTLLKILSGVYDATEGNIITKGKIAPLLELGAGFDSNYTGKANIFLNGAFLGYSEDFLKDKYDEIVEFSELGEAINYPVKTYSSGMRAKLGFAIATIVEPDILIIDEILSVGDIKFSRKSGDKIKSLINSGVTVLLVSHSISQIRELCNKAIWIDEGELKMMGEVNKVCDAYIEAAKNASKEQLKNLKLE